MPSVGRPFTGLREGKDSRMRMLRIWHNGYLSRFPRPFLRGRKMKAGGRFDRGCCESHAMRSQHTHSKAAGRGGRWDERHAAT